jgi:tetratricopeptide (TPR) repeat protein
MFMKPGTILTIAAILVFCLFGMVAADDCGCEFGWDGPGPSDGWDTHDDWDSSAGSRQDDSSADSSGDSTMDESSDSSSGADSGISDDGGSSSSSSGSESSSPAGGGSVEEAVVWRMKGDDLFEKGLYNESLEAYEKAINLDPYALKSWTGKGRVLLALELPAGAAEAYERAIRLDPGNAATYVQLGDALAAGGEYVQAVENYLKALAMNPNLPGVEEKISGVQEAMVAALQTAEATPVTTTIPEVEETATVPVTTPGETGTGTTAVPGTPQAGIPGVQIVFAALAICAIVSRVTR